MPAVYSRGHMERTWPGHEMLVRVLPPVRQQEGNRSQRKHCSLKGSWSEATFPSLISPSEHPPPCPIHTAETIAPSPSHPGLSPFGQGDNSRWSFIQWTVSLALVFCDSLYSLTHGPYHLEAKWQWDGAQVGRERWDPLCPPCWETKPLPAFVPTRPFTHLVGKTWHLQSQLQTRREGNEQNRWMGSILWHTAPLPFRNESLIPTVAGSANGTQPSALNFLWEVPLLTRAASSKVLYYLGLAQVQWLIAEELFMSSPLTPTWNNFEELPQIQGFPWDWWGLHWDCTAVQLLPQPNLVPPFNKCWSPKHFLIYFLKMMVKWPLKYFPKNTRVERGSMIKGFQIQVILETTTLAASRIFIMPFRRCRT